MYGFSCISGSCLTNTLATLYVDRYRVRTVCIPQRQHACVSFVIEVIGWCVCGAGGAAERAKLNACGQQIDVYGWLQLQ
jgi:hypothetical protein